jgi:deoxyribose-phosphate aldolase
MEEPRIPTTHTASETVKPLAWETNSSGIIGLVDLTDLSSTCTDEDVERLCSRAVEHRTAAVCVWPRFVKLARTNLAGPSGPGLATVVNFPHGNDEVDDVLRAVELAVIDGADEIDVVVPYTSLLAGDLAPTARMLNALTAQLAGAKVRTKAILESGALEIGHVELATKIAVDAGIDFVKTSTGKHTYGASLDDVWTILRTIQHCGSHTTGVKVSGGVRTTADARRYLHLVSAVMGEGWITKNSFRFGASGLLDALLETGEHTGGGY